MIVVDGRFPGQAAGMTIGELIYLVRQLGLYSALNLDGGGVRRRSGARRRAS